MEKVIVKNIDRYISLNNELVLEDPYNLKIDKTKFLNENEDNLVSDKLSIYIKTYEGKDIGFMQTFKNSTNQVFVEKIFLRKEFRNVRMCIEMLDYIIRINDDAKIKFIGVNDKNDLIEALKYTGFKMEKEHVQMEKELLDIEESYIFDGIKTFSHVGDAKWIYDFMKNCMAGNIFNYSLDEIEKIIKSKDDLCLVFYKDNKPIGFITAFINEKRNVQQNKRIIYIEEIAIDRKFRNKGFGRNVINHILNKGIDRGMETGRLHVYRDNTKAHKLYRKLRFKEVKSIGHWVKN